MTYTMSIEPTGGESFQYGFHLGTDERLARELVEEKFHARNRHNMPTTTIALILGRKIIDFYDGTWTRGG